MTVLIPLRKSQPFGLFLTDSDRRACEKANKISRTPCRAQTFDRNGYNSTQQVSELGYLKNFNEIYELNEKIGAGGFATVYLGTNKKTGEKHAIKVIQKKYIGGFIEERVVSRLRNEVDIYNTLGPSLNVAYLYGAYEDESSVKLALELCTGGALWNRVKWGRYTEKSAARIIRDIFRAIAQCHAKDIVMRDVKPENFLFLNKSEDSPLKAIDFGLARYCRESEILTNRAGTPIYIAPEVLLKEYGQKADVWSAGIISYQLLTGRLPYVGEHGLMKNWKIHTNKEIFRAVLYADLDFKYRPWDRLSNEAKDFLRFLLKRKAGERPTALEALNHPWITKGAEMDSSAEEEELHCSIVQRLQMFGTFGRLKKVALRKIVEFVKTDSLKFADLQITFSQLDPAGTGKVKCSVLRDMLMSDEYNLSETEVMQLISQMSLDEDGYVDYFSWFAALIDWKELQEDEEWNVWIEKAFSSFDMDQNGLLNQDDLTKALCGEFCEVPDTVPNVLRVADKDGDGQINFEDFSDVMRTEKVDDITLFDKRENKNKNNK